MTGSKFKCVSCRDDDIFDALEDAIKRGVEVSIVADEEENGGSGDLVSELADAGADVRLFTESKFSKLHAKLTIFDNSTALTGSFNWYTSVSHVLATLKKYPTGRTAPRRTTWSSSSLLREQAMSASSLPCLKSSGMRATISLLAVVDPRPGRRKLGINFCSSIKSSRSQGRH